MSKERNRSYKNQGRESFRKQLWKKFEEGKKEANDFLVKEWSRSRKEEDHRQGIHEWAFVIIQALIMKA